MYWLLLCCCDQNDRQKQLKGNTVLAHGFSATHPCWWVGCDSSPHYSSQEVGRKNRKGRSKYSFQCPLLVTCFLQLGPTSTLQLTAIRSSRERSFIRPETSGSNCLSKPPSQNAQRHALLVLVIFNLAKLTVQMNHHRADSLWRFPFRSVSLGKCTTLTCMSYSRQRMHLQVTYLQSGLGHLRIWVSGSPGPAC